MEQRYVSIPKAKNRYGGTDAAWRKWVREGSLGNAVCRLGRLVVIDTVVLDERLSLTNQLLVSQTKKESQ